MNARWFSLLMLAFLAGPKGTHGAVVTFDFAGFVNEVQNNASVFQPNVALDTDAVGSFSYDTATAGASNGPYSSGYPNALKSFSLNVGAGQLTWYPASLDVTGISVCNDAAAPPPSTCNPPNPDNVVDLFAGLAGQSSALLGGLTLPAGGYLNPNSGLRAGINLGGLSTLLNDQNLPNSLDFSQMTWHAVRLTPGAASPSDGYLRIELTSLTLRAVPEPGTLALLGLGLAGLAVTRIRKQ